MCSYEKEQETLKKLLEEVEAEEMCVEEAEDATDEEEQDEQIFSAHESESEQSISGGEQDKPELSSSTRLSFVGRFLSCDTEILCFDTPVFCFYLQEKMQLHFGRSMHLRKRMQKLERRT